MISGIREALMNKESYQPKFSIQKLNQLERLAQGLDLALAINEISSINFKKLKRIKKDTNKGDFGSVVILGGNKGMHGSLYLAGRAALLCGSGKVYLASLDSDFTTDLLMPELMTISPKEVLKNLDNYSVIVVGPGLGQDEKAHKIIEKIIELRPNNIFIFDADALNLLAKGAKWHYKFRALPHKVITPHPKEASRLLNLELDVIQKNRILAVRKLNEYYNSVTLLKGYGSLIYNSNQLFVNPTGNPGLSTAGQGDTLCGIMAAFIAQGLDMLDAVRLAAYIQGMAADELANENGGYIGMLATDIAYKSKAIINQLL